jgi:putative membrane protein
VRTRAADQTPDRGWRTWRLDEPLRDVGEEPDPRFTLANERTFLAWTRTSLALLAGGLAVSEFLHSEPRTERLIIAIPFVVIAGVVAFTSYRRWEIIERALRLGKPLPHDPLPRGLAASIGCVALASLVVLVTR